MNTLNRCVVYRLFEPHLPPWMTGLSRDLLLAQFPAKNTYHPCDPPHTHTPLSPVSAVTLPWEGCVCGLLSVVPLS